MELFDQLIKNWNYWIRFELGLTQLEGKAYFEEINYRATAIINALFDKNEEILLINCIPNRIDDKKVHLPKMRRFIRNKKLIYGLKCKSVPDEFDEELEIKEYRLNVKKEDIRLHDLIQSIYNQNGYGFVYLVNVTKETVFHMYDDRGCDVYSLDKEKLQPLYSNFRSWILDYDRIKIDQKFEEGLFNSSETAKETEERLELNRKKVQETGINLYQTNTCYITHQLEIPKQFGEECINEMTQTGFEIHFEQKDHDAMIVSATKLEALALIDYQSELMTLYSKKYKGKYNGWSIIKAF